MALLFVRKLSMTNHLSYQKLTQKMLQLEKYITSHFKIDLNIFLIYKTIKIEISTRGTIKQSQRGK